jgi:hypothetical protein
MTDIVVSAQQELNRAQEALAIAQAEADRARHVELVNELAKVRAELRQARSTHAGLVSRIHPARERWQNQQRRINSALEAIADSEHARPACADWLPDDPEVVAWKKNHAALKIKCDRLIQQRDKMEDANDITSEANKYEGFTGIIAQLTFAEANIVRMLEGRPGMVRFEGGVSGVR